MLDGKEGVAAVVVVVRVGVVIMVRMARGGTVPMNVRMGFGDKQRCDYGRGGLVANPSRK